MTDDKALKAEFARKALEAYSAWPGIREGNEPEPTHEQIDSGWQAIKLLQVDFVGRGLSDEDVEEIDTWIAEAVSDIARAGWSREEIRKRISKNIDWELEED